MRLIVGSVFGVLVFVFATAGAVSKNPHPFTRAVRCFNNELTHSVGGDGNERGNIDHSVYFFQPSGEATVLASGIVIVARRFRPTLEAS